MLEEFGTRNPKAGLDLVGIKDAAKIRYNLREAELVGIGRITR